MENAETAFPPGYPVRKDKRNSSRDSCHPAKRQFLYKMIAGHIPVLFTDNPLVPIEIELIQPERNRKIFRPLFLHKNTGNSFRALP